MVSWKYRRNNAATAFESIVIPSTVYPDTLKILKSSKSRKNQIYFAYHSIHRSFQNFRPRTCCESTENRNENSRSVTHRTSIRIQRIDVETIQTKVSRASCTSKRTRKSRTRCIRRRKKRTRHRDGVAHRL